MKKNYLASFKRFCERVSNWIKYMSWSKRVAWMILFLAVYLPWEYIENQSWLGVGIERFKKRKDIFCSVKTETPGGGLNKRFQFKLKLC